MLNEAEPAKRAPDPLRLVQQFVNSVEYEGGVIDEDDLADAKALRRWMRDRDLIASDSKVTEAERVRAVEVREGLRGLLVAHNGGEPDPVALDRLERAAERARLRTTFPDDGPPRLAPDCSGVDGGLAQLLAIVADAATEGTWRRLKACADDGCRWAFYDHSKNRAGRWCSMETCGNRHKARTARARAADMTARSGSGGRKSEPRKKARS